MALFKIKKSLIKEDDEIDIVTNSSNIINVLEDELECFCLNDSFEIIIKTLPILDRQNFLEGWFPYAIVKVKEKKTKKARTVLIIYKQFSIMTNCF